MTILGVDYHPEPILTVVEEETADRVKVKTFTPKEIEALALAGDIRATMKGVVNSIPVAVGETVAVGVGEEAGCRTQARSCVVVRPPTT